MEPTLDKCVRNIFWGGILLWFFCRAKDRRRIPPLEPEFPELKFGWIMADNYTAQPQVLRTLVITTPTMVVSTFEWVGPCCLNLFLVGTFVSVVKQWLSGANFLIETPFKYLGSLCCLLAQLPYHMSSNIRASVWSLCVCQHCEYIDSEVTPLYPQYSLTGSFMFSRVDRPLCHTTVSVPPVTQSQIESIFGWITLYDRRDSIHNGENLFGLLDTRKVITRIAICLTIARLSHWGRYFEHTGGIIAGSWSLKSHRPLPLIWYSRFFPETWECDPEFNFRVANNPRLTHQLSRDTFPEFLTSLIHHS